MFDLNASIFDPEFAEELDEERLEEYINKLTAEFEKSPEAERFRQKFDTSIGWISTYIHYAANDFSATPATITPGETFEILFEIFPRKVSVEASAAGEIIGELSAFWQYLKRTRALAQADKILALLTDAAADHLEEELEDGTNFGMAKTFVMAGNKAGFDMTNADEMTRDLLAYNRSLLDRQAPDEQSDRSRQPVPTTASIIRNTGHRIGRNDPCSCGSGKKYKKCCGR